MERAYWEDKKYYHILHVGDNTITLWKPGMVSEGLFGGNIDSYTFSGKMPGGVMFSNHRLQETTLAHAMRKVVEVYLEQCKNAMEQHRKELAMCNECADALKEMLLDLQGEEWMNIKYPLYKVKAKSMLKGELGHIAIQKVDSKIEISLGEGQVTFTVKEAKEIITVLRKCIND